MNGPRAKSLTVKIDRVYDENTYFFNSVCKIYLNGKRTGKILLTTNINQESILDDAYETSSFLNKGSKGNFFIESNSFTVYNDSNIEYGDLLEIVCFYQKKYISKYIDKNTN